MKIPASILAVVAATLLVSPGRAQEPTRKEQADASARKVKELQKDRIAVLKELKDQSAALFKNARASFDELLEVRRLLIEAELEAAETEAQRVELYKNLIAALKEYELWTDQRHKAGRGNPADILKAKAARLQAEIHLEQAKMKQARDGK